TVGKTKTLPVAFANVGSAACTVGAGKLVSQDFTNPCSPGSCQGFSIVPPLAQSSIAPGQSTQINIQFAPRDTSQIPIPTVYLNSQTGDKAITPSECIQGFPPNTNDGCIAVAMAGQGVVSNLAVIPAD